MIPDPEDTIVAVASASGMGARAIVRLSGGQAVEIAARMFHVPPNFEGLSKLLLEHEIQLPDVAASLPADLYLRRGPNTYTGQDLAEIHTLQCPPLVDLLISQILKCGARAAQRGEFSLRAFLAGKLDLPKAEAILGVIEAKNREGMKEALKQLAGGMSRPLEGLRESLLDLLAEVEAGLDFSEEDIQFVAQPELLNRLSKGLAQITVLSKQLESRSINQRPVRVVLVGRPNAGKSSLFNALTGESAALVSADEGTTRDYLTRTMEVDGFSVEIIDTAGWCDPRTLIDEQAQRLGREQLDQADLILLCLEKGHEPTSEEAALLRERKDTLTVVTKADLPGSALELLATSAVSGEGIKELKKWVTDSCRALRQSPLSSSLSRCRNHVAATLAHLRQAHSVVLFQEPPELLAAELRGALDQLGEMVGAVYTDDLLDRIFSRFCIGK